MGDLAARFSPANGKNGSLLRGQSAVELMIVLAVGLIVLGYVISTSQSRIGSSQQALAFSIAKTSVNDLSSAADAVYYEGVGSIRQVKFIIPEGAVSTSIASNSINIRIATQQGFSDASANTKSQICPNSALPSKFGSYLISVESLANCIAIGATSNLTVSSTLISVNSYPGNWLSKSVNYSNTGSAPILVNLNLSFISPDVSVSFLNFGDDIFTLNPGQQKEIPLNITISNAALGSYSGVLKANGSEGTKLTTAIVIQVSSQNCQQQIGPCVGGGNVSLIEIKTYSSNSYSQPKEIFDPTDTILLQGGNWDPTTSLTLDVRDPADSFSLPGYPKSLTTNSSGGFNDSLYSTGLSGLSGYIVRASGTFGGSPQTKTGNFDISACS